MAPHELQAQWPWLRVELGLTRSEFDDCTPHEILELMRLWGLKERRADLRVAQMRLTIAESSGATTANGQPVTLGHFIKLPPQPLEPDSEEEIERQFRKATNS